MHKPCIYYALTMHLPHIYENTLANNESKFELMSLSAFCQNYYKYE